jgi:hypothetical protein
MVGWSVVLTSTNLEPARLSFEQSFEQVDASPGPQAVDEKWLDALKPDHNRNARCGSSGRPGPGYSVIMTAPQPMPELARKTIQVPVKGGAAHWSDGTAIVGRPGTTEVLLTLPSAASRTPWARLDLAGDALEPGSGMPGPLRAAYFPDRGDDPRWWVLGLYGVGRVDPDDPTAVRDVVRTGIGRYPSRMFSLGDDHVAIGTDLSGNVVVLSRTSGKPVGRLRLPKGRTSWVATDGLVRVFAPREGKVYDVDPTRMKVVRRHGIPCGKGERLAGKTMFYLSGEVTPIRVLAEGETPQAGVPVVLGEGVGSAVGTTVRARALIGLDVDTLELVATGSPDGVPVPLNAVEVLGTDHDGRLVVSTQDGFLLVDAGTGAILAEHIEPGGLVGAGMADGHSTVALATMSDLLGTLALVSW